MNDVARLDEALRLLKEAVDNLEWYSNPQRGGPRVGDLRLINVGQIIRNARATLASPTPETGTAAGPGEACRMYQPSTYIGTPCYVCGGTKDQHRSAGPAPEPVKPPATCYCNGGTEMRHPDGSQCPGVNGQAAPATELCQDCGGTGKYTGVRRTGEYPPCSKCKGIGRTPTAGTAPKGEK